METINKQLKQYYENFIYLNNVIEEVELKLDDEYMKINNTYFRVFCTHYESFFILIEHNHMSSAIILMRTLLELTVKNFYIHFIEKNKGKSISKILENNYTFFKMTEELENYKDESGASFDGLFSQFTKSELATYEKFSLFSHGKGEYLKSFYKQGKISYSEKQTLEVIDLANKLFISNCMLYLFSQEKFEKLRLILNQHKNTPFFSD